MLRDEDVVTIMNKRTDALLANKDRPIKNEGSMEEGV